MKWVLVWLIRLYQYFISPLLGKSCRFHPSCSEYAKEAINIHGWHKGICLSIYRIARCQPFSHGGYDPVPILKISAKQSSTIRLNDE